MRKIFMVRIYPQNILVKIKYTFLNYCTCCCSCSLVVTMYPIITCMCMTRLLCTLYLHPVHIMYIWYSTSSLCSIYIYIYIYIYLHPVHITFVIISQKTVLNRALVFWEIQFWNTEASMYWIVHSCTRFTI